MTTASTLRVAINAQLPRGAAGGTEQNLVCLVRALLEVLQDETLYLIGLGEHSDWLQAHVHGRHRVFPASAAGGTPLPRSTFRQWLKSLLGLRRPSAAVFPEARALLHREQVHLAHFPYQTHYPVDVPFLFEPWDLQHLHLPEFFTPAEIQRREMVYRSGCEKAALVVTATAWTKNDLVARYGLPPEKIAVIRRGAWLSDQRQMNQRTAAAILAPLGLPTDFLFFPAKDFPHKNHLRLFEAVAKVRRRGIDARLVCCGRVLDKNKPVWRRRLEELGIVEAVRLLGRVEDEVVTALYARAKALVFPSLFEGLGIPILEAMHHGLPIVTTRAACIPEVAEDAAIYADGLSAESLADAVALLYTQPQQVEQCRNRGRALIQKYDWRETGRNFLACYRCLSGISATEEDRKRFHALTATADVVSHAA